MTNPIKETSPQSALALHKIGRQSSCAGPVLKVAGSVALLALGIIALVAAFSFPHSGCYYYLLGGGSGAALLGLGALIISSIRCHQDLKAARAARLEQLTHEDISLGNGIIQRTYTLTLDSIDKKDFKKWVLQHVDQTSKSGELLDATVIKALEEWNPPEGSVSITFSKLFSSPKAFQDQLNTKLPLSLESPTPSCKQVNFTYDNAGEIHIDFANAFDFGGGWRRGGNVQEEQMVFEFFKMVLTAYVCEKNGVALLPATGNPASSKTEPTPFVIKKAQRSYCIGTPLYGEKLKDFKGLIESEVTRLKDQKEVTIVGIAARNWKGHKQVRYTMNDLKYHLKAALLAFSVEKDPTREVHSGKWGCGVFKNDLHVITALQLIAARLAKVTLVLHHVNSKDVEAIQTWLDGFKTPQGALNALLQEQGKPPEQWKLPSSSK